MSVQDMVAWLKKYVGEDFGLGVGESREELIEHVQLELAVVVDNYAYVTSTGIFDTPGDVEDVEQENMRRIMSVVLGSPEIAREAMYEALELKHQKLSDRLPHGLLAKTDVLMR